MFRKVSYLLFCSLILSLSAKAQAIDYDYVTETVYGVNKNTNGGLIGGLFIRHSRMIDDNMFHVFGLELSNVKHPKEVRYTSFLGNTYIWGKQNYLYSIRPHYGRELILFRKAPQQGVQVSAIGAAGPTFGIVSPYYIDYATSRFDSERVPFDPSVHDNRGEVLGPGRIFQGLGESEIKVGAHAKVGLAFEFGTFKTNVTGVEAGYMIEAFPQEIVLVPTAQNRSVFHSVYISLYYGLRK